MKGNFWKRNQLVVVLVVLVVFLGFIKIKYGYKGGPLPPQISPQLSEETTPTPTAEPIAIPTSEGYDLWQLLPYSGKGFTIDRYTDKTTLAIKLKGIDKRVAEKAIYTWLTEQKVATESYKLEFTQ